MLASSLWYLALIELVLNFEALQNNHIEIQTLSDVDEISNFSRLGPAPET